MIKIRGIPTGMFYSYLQSDQEAIEKYDLNIEKYKIHRDEILYQDGPKSEFKSGFRFKYCLSDYREEFENTDRAIYYIIFSRKYLHQVIDEFNVKIPTVRIDIIKETPAWVTKKEDAYKEVNYTLEYEEAGGEEVSIYLLKITVSDKFKDSAKFVAFYLTMTYIRLFCLGEPFVHFGVTYNPDKDGTLMEFAIKVSNEKITSKDRLIDIHSLTNRYNVEAADLVLLGDIEKVNKIYPSLTKVKEVFSEYGDNRQTWQMKQLREARLGKKDIKDDVKDNGQVYVDEIQPIGEEIFGIDLRKVKNDYRKLDFWEKEKIEYRKFKVGDLVRIRYKFRNFYGVTGEDMTLGKVIKILIPNDKYDGKPHPRRQQKEDIKIKIIEHRYEGEVGSEYPVESYHYFCMNDEEEMDLPDQINNFGIGEFVIPKSMVNRHLVYGRVIGFRDKKVKVIVNKDEYRENEGQIKLYDPYEIEVVKDDAQINTLVHAGNFIPKEGIYVKGIPGYHYGVTNDEMLKGEIIRAKGDYFTVRIIKHINPARRGGIFDGLNKIFFALYEEE